MRRLTQGLIHILVQHGLDQDYNDVAAIAECLMGLT